MVWRSRYEAIVAMRNSLWLPQARPETFFDGPDCASNNREDSLSICLRKHVEDIHPLFGFDSETTRDTGTPQVFSVAHQVSKTPRDTIEARDS